MSMKRPHARPYSAIKVFSKSAILPIISIVALFLLYSTTAIFAHPSSAKANKDSLLTKSSPVQILKGETPEQKERSVRKQRFINDVAARVHITLDGHLIFEVPPDSTPGLSLTPEELQQIVPTGGDPLADEIRQRFSGITPTVSLNQLIKKLVESIHSSRKKAPVTNLPIPTNLEIDALKVLWEQTIASPSEIYASLDPSWPATSEDLNKILKNMTDRGLLGRKKVSASHEFTLFGVAKIELSSKNRKNQVYLYWPTIPRERLIRYVDAKRYLAYSASRAQAANGYTSETHKVLENKLLRLMQ